jgi:hypothetical protein
MVSTGDLAWTYCFHHLIACVDRPKMLLQNIYNHVCIFVLTQTTLWILTTVSTSNPIPTIIKNWNIDGNVTLEKLNYGQQYIFLHSIEYHTFFHRVYCYTLLFKNLRKQTIFNINKSFMIRTTYAEFQTSTTIIPQGNLTTDCEIKQHI